MEAVHLLTIKMSEIVYIVVDRVELHIVPYGVGTRAI